jgi:hypothetical protein
LLPLTQKRAVFVWELLQAQFDFLPLFYILFFVEVNFGLEAVDVLNLHPLQFLQILPNDPTPVRRMAF